MRITKFFALAALLLGTACSTQLSDTTQLEEVSFAELPGWQNDPVGEAFVVFTSSCQVNARRGNAYTTRMGEEVGSREKWLQVCAMTQRYTTITDAEARLFFEGHFTPYRVFTEREPQGHLTGYYLPLLQGSLTPTPTARFPVYGLPAGFTKGMQLPERAAIEAGALNGRAPIIMYVEDPVMLFFLHIQGSGKVQLTDGRIVTLQYAGQNGHPYVAIGRMMKEQGMLETVSMQTIRDWLYENPTQANAVMNTNPSYIFFTLKTDEPMAKGSLGLSLTPLRSLAIDDDRATYGVPTYIATSHWNYYTRGEEPLNRLLISQDTGGALKGPHRGDIFYGIGSKEAEWAAGQQNSRGDVYWLLPK